MTSRDFCYWLQGFFELRGTEDMSSEQVQCVAKHLALVFTHEIDPSHGTPEHVEKLRDIHAPKPPEPPEPSPDTERKLEEIARLMARSGPTSDLKLMC